MPKLPWTSEMIAFARTLWDKNYSANDVSRALNREFSTDFSRNAVIGKLYRSGASKKMTPGIARISSATPRKLKQISSATPRKLKPNGFKLASALRAVQRKNEVVEEPQLTLTKELDPATNVDLLHLEEGHCKWPVGDALYCGSPIIMKRKPYCSIHTRQSGDRVCQARMEENYNTRRAKPTRGRFF